MKTRYLLSTLLIFRVIMVASLGSFKTESLGSLQDFKHEVLGSMENSKLALETLGASKPTFSFYNEMQTPPIPGFQGWCILNFTKDHSNRQYVQKPSEWTNLTFSIPTLNTNEIQLTAWNTSWGPYSYATSAIMYFSHVRYENYIFMSIIWWGPPWQLKVGWRGGDLRNVNCTKVF